MSEHKDVDIEKLLMEINKLTTENQRLLEENIRLKKYLAESVKDHAGQKPLNDKEIITKIISMYLNGNSLLKIANEMTAKGYKTKRGGNWHKSTVKFILQNEQYVHMGYVNEEEFQLVQKKLKENRLGEK